MIRDLAILAVRQYKAWEAFADEWPLYRDDGQERCNACGTGIIALADSRGVNREYTREERLALITGHLRNYHRDLEDMVYKEAGIE